jgi:hypothetical protein
MVSILLDLKRSTDQHDKKISMQAEIFCAVAQKKELSAAVWRLISTFLDLSTRNVCSRVSRQFQKDIVWHPKAWCPMELGIHRDCLADKSIHSIWTWSFLKGLEKCPETFSKVTFGCRSDVLLSSARLELDLIEAFKEVCGPHVRHLEFKRHASIEIAEIINKCLKDISFEELTLWLRLSTDVSAKRPLIQRSLKRLNIVLQGSIFQPIEFEVHLPPIIGKHLESIHIRFESSAPRQPSLLDSKIPKIKEYILPPKVSIRIPETTVQWYSLFDNQVLEQSTSVENLDLGTSLKSNFWFFTQERVTFLKQLRVLRFGFALEDVYKPRNLDECWDYFPGVASSSSSVKFENLECLYVNIGYRLDWLVECSYKILLGWIQGHKQLKKVLLRLVTNQDPYQTAHCHAYLKYLEGFWEKKFKDVFDVLFVGHLKTTDDADFDWPLGLQQISKTRPTFFLAY